MTRFTKDWFLDALARAVRTFAQVFLGFMTVGMAFHEVEWLRALSVAGVSAVYSILTSIVTGLPESSTDGELMIDNTGETSKWLFKVDTDPDDIEDKRSIRFKVKADAALKPEETDISE